MQHRTVKEQEKNVFEVEGSAKDFNRNLRDSKILGNLLQASR
jgi:hypothetical protein